MAPKLRYEKFGYGKYWVYVGDSLVGSVRKVRMTSGSATWWRARHSPVCGDCYAGPEVQTREAAARMLL